MVVGVDLTEYAPMVIEHALDQAARQEAPELHFLHVVEGKKQPVAALNERMVAAVYPALQTFNQHGTDWRARLHLRRGKPDEQITALAADVLADLIVIGQFGLHRRRLPHRVLAAAASPTLIIGMPHPLDVSQCPACTTVREYSDGDRWFCDDHIDDAAPHAVSPMTSWTGGRRAA